MRWKWLVVGLIILAAAAGIVWWMIPVYQEGRIDGRELLVSALKNTASAQSFRYELESYLTVEGRKEVISKVEGEKSSEGNIHIKGEMVKTPVDIYHFKQSIFNWDSFSKRWLVINDAQSNSTKVLISELDPLSNFNFKNIGEVKKEGFETIDGSKCMIICCRPSVENELMEILWQDFTYKIWIDINERVIKKTALSAVSKNNSNTFLSLKVSFKNYNSNIKINKPNVE
ncbi:MAG: hypothetical protein ACM3PP_13510 [Candidatus Saccharibacteria bacterium]